MNKKMAPASRRLLDSRTENGADGAGAAGRQAGSGARPLNTQRVQQMPSDAVLGQAAGNEVHVSGAASLPENGSEGTSPGHMKEPLQFLNQRLE